MILRLKTQQPLYSGWAPYPHFYPVSGEFNSGHLDTISYYLKRNAQGHSYGLVLDIGLSSDTRVTCCVFGVAGCQKFQVPKELNSNNLALPIVVVQDSIGFWSSALYSEDPERSWVSSSVHGYNRSEVSFETVIDLSGYSVGLKNDSHEAGTFGFYGYDENGKVRGFSAFHTMSSAKTGNSIVSPSNLELALRYHNLRRMRNPDKKYQEELNVLEASFCNQRQESTSIDQNADIQTVRVIGKSFGTVLAHNCELQGDILDIHNQRLCSGNTQQKSFAHPSKENKSQELIGAISLSILTGKSEEYPSFDNTTNSYSQTWEKHYGDQRQHTTCQRHQISSTWHESVQAWKDYRRDCRHNQRMHIADMAWRHNRDRNSGHS